MTINIMNQYIELTKKQINLYMRLVFGKKFNKKYFDVYLEKYINIRYYNYYEYEINNSIRKKILYFLRQTSDELIMNNIQDRDLIETMCVFFYYVLYFDNVVYYKELRNIVQKIAKLRIKVLNSKSSNFEEELYMKMKESISQKEEFLKRFNSEDFYIKFVNYPDKLNIYRVNLKHNIKFPVVYSEFAINKAFNMYIVSEDKLFVEYYLTVAHIVRDVLKQNCKRKYILEFTDTILNKKNKLKSLLNIINNIAIQERICLKIRYEQFIKNKEKIYSLMRDGYKFAIILDNSFKINFKNIESLKVFQFVIINKNLKQYNEITINTKELHNKIEV